MSGQEEDAAAYCRRGMETVDGYFGIEDAWAFVLFDALQRSLGIRGDLLEVGAYLGKSAILLGYLASSDEGLVVCDPFEDASFTEGLAVQDKASYDGVTQQRFEQNYRRFHQTTPDVRVGFSSDVLPALPMRSYRFIHIDGSHEFDAVQGDVAATKGLLCPGGVVAFDDMFELHTPGVQAAVWQAVVEAGLIPLVTTRKLYATWEPHPIIDAVRGAFEASAELDIVDEHLVGGRRFLQAKRPGPPDKRSRRIARAITPPGLVKLGRRVSRSVRG